MIGLSKKDVTLQVSDLTKIYAVPKSLNVLVFSEGLLLKDKPINFVINGVQYTRYTDNQGWAKLNINLPSGSYPTTVFFQGDSEYNPKTEYVTVTVTKQDNVLLISDFKKTYGESKALKVGLYETTTTVPVPNKTVKFTINGVTYTRTTNNDGEASLNINLRKGEYRCVVNSPSDDNHNSTQGNCNIKIMAETHMDGTDIMKMEDATAVYQCAVYDPWSRIDADVHITVNGKTYTRHTGEDGLAKLNIKLPAGEYDIRAEFKGDNLNHPSSTVNHITSKPYQQTPSKNVNGVQYPGNNRGFMESHVMVKQWSPEWAKAHKGITFWDDSGASFHKDVRFTSYEITETDPRVKTAKFTTPVYIDLTGGQTWAYISSPYHENFGGKVLKVDFDKDKKLYTYQCQDGRRQYLTKARTITKDRNVYDLIESFLVFPYYEGTVQYVPIKNEDKIKYSKALSGLRPKKDYYIPKTAGVTLSNYNPLDQKSGERLDYDSLIDKIMNYALNSNTGSIDVHFSPEGVCQIEPVNFVNWLKTGFRLIHQDLVQYKYGFDTTNILTGIKVQTTQNDENDRMYQVKDPGNEKAKPLNEQVMELGYYFGVNIGMISPITKQVETENTESSNNNNGGNSSGGGGYFVDMGKPHKFAVGTDRINDSGSDLNLVNKVINALEAKGHSAYSLGRGDSVNQNHGLSSSTKGVINIFIVGGICAGTVKDYADGLGSYYHYDGMIMMFANCTTDNWISCNALKSKKQVRAHDDGFSSGIDTSITPHEMFEKHKNKMAYIAGQPNESFDSLVTKLVNGQFNCGGSTASSSGSSNGNSETTTTTVIDDLQTYNKALEKMSESVRDLLKFEIKLPLNHPMFKELHTNQFLWTELPTEFKLGNLSKVFQFMGSWKQTRPGGLKYVENRWYIEKNVVKMDSNGLFATLTLNAFPSSYSQYSNAYRAYATAYDQAFKQQEEQKNQNNNNNNNNNSQGQARLGNDCTDTNSMACATGRYRGHAGDNENFDNCAKKGYAQEGRGYYNWARQYKTPIELCKAMANRFSYHDHYNNWYCPEKIHNNGGTIYANCYDACRYVKVCMDSCGFDCIVVTGSIYEGGHGWNAVKHNGRWYTFDLCYAQRGTEWPGTNTLRLCNEW